VRPGAAGRLIGQLQDATVAGDAGPPLRQVTLGLAAPVQRIEPRLDRRRRALLLDQLAGSREVGQRLAVRRECAGPSPGRQRETQRLLGGRSDGGGEPEMMRQLGGPLLDPLARQRLDRRADPGMHRCSACAARAAVQALADHGVAEAVAVGRLGDQLRLDRAV
jgi:hypothetical protein